MKDHQDQAAHDPMWQCSRTYEEDRCRLGFLQSASLSCPGLVWCRKVAVDVRHARKGLGFCKHALTPVLASNPDKESPALFLGNVVYYRAGWQVVSTSSEAVPFRKSFTKGMLERSLCVTMGKIFTRWGGLRVHELRDFSYVGVSLRNSGKYMCHGRGPGVKVVS